MRLLVNTAVKDYVKVAKPLTYLLCGSDPRHYKKPAQPPMEWIWVMESGFLHKDMGHLGQD